MKSHELFVVALVASLFTIGVVVPVLRRGGLTQGLLSA